MNLIFLMLGRQITLEVDNLKICGRLVHVSNLQRDPDHRFCVLALETAQGRRLIVRGWDKISF
jgi:hypothetical protein